MPLEQRLAGVKQNDHDNFRKYAQAAPALAMLLVDPRLPMMAKRSATSLQLVGAYPYNAIFTPALTAYQVRNAVDAFRYIMTRMGEEASAAANQQERLTYRHGAYVLAFVLMKQLRDAIDGTTRIHAGKLATAAGPVLDSLRQSLWEETKPFLAERGPLAIFRNQADVNAIVRLIATLGYNLEDDKALTALQALNTVGQPYPERLFSYISGKAPKIDGIS